MILNEYSKTAWRNGASPDINKANLDNLEQGVYDVTAKAMELAAYEVNAAASAVSAAASATAASASAVSASASAAASAVAYTDLAQDVTDLTAVVDTKASKTQPVWINAPLIAPIVNYGSSYQTCQYRKDEFGIVHIRGAVKGGIPNAVVFVLPVGYRPALNISFPAVQNNLFGTCTVFLNGNVVQGGTGVGTSFSFGNVSFVGV